MYVLMFFLHTQYTVVLIFQHLLIPSGAVTHCLCWCSGFVLSYSVKLLHLVSV